MRIAWVLMVAACGGGGGSGGDDDDTSADAPKAKPANSGSITVQGFVSSNANGGSASALFVMGGGGCTLSTVGECQVSEACASAPSQTVSAGIIDVTGAAVPISLAPGTDGAYPTLSNYMAASPWLAGGESITATAAGATVPAFHATLTAPSRATITSPAMPAAGSLLAVSRANDFSFAWTGGGAGKLQIYLSSGSTTIFCKFDASAHSATIPAATVAMLPAGMGGFAMASVNETEVDTGDWAVTLVGYYNAVWQAGSGIVSGGATLQ